MAAASGQSDSVVSNTCSICLEAFRQPRTLPCQHSLCSVCLQEYLEQCLVSKDMKQFPCPLCRASISIKQHDIIQIENIVKQFDLVSFSEIVDENESRDTSVNCDACSRDNVLIAAAKMCKECNENICKECANYHSKNKLLSSHSLSDILRHPRNAASENAISKIVQANIRFKCERHEMKRFKYICIGHDVICCSKCVIFDHRQCNDIRSLEDYKECTLFDNDKRSLQEGFRDIDDKLLAFSANETHMESTLDQKRKQFDDDVSSWKEHIHTAIDEELDRFYAKSCSLIKDLKQITEANHHKVDAFRHEMEYCKPLLDLIDSDSMEKSHTVVYAKQMINTLSIKRKELTSCFKTGSCEKFEWKINAKPLIRVLQKCLQQEVIQIHPPDTCTLCRFTTLDTVLNFKQRSNGQTPCLRDCVALDEHYFVCTDERNNILRVIDSVGQKEIYYIPIRAEPFGITKLDNQTLAVSMPQSKCIDIMRFSVDGDRSITIKLVKSIESKFGIYGIQPGTVDNSTVLIALDKDAGCFHVYDMDGKEKLIITLKVSNENRPSRGWNPLSYANYFAVNSNAKELYISCYRTNKIMCVDFSGVCKWVYTHPALQTPFAIRTGPGGNLFVCCYGRCQIHMLDRSGNHIGTLLSASDGLRGPISFDFDPDFKHCIVCEDDGSQKTLKRFSLHTS